MIFSRRHSQFRRFFLPAIHHFVVVFHQSITQFLTQLQEKLKTSLHKGFIAF